MLGCQISRITNIWYQVNILCTMVSLLYLGRQCSWISWALTTVIYLQGMRYARTNNTSTKFWMYSRMAQSDWASQYLYQVVFLTQSSWTGAYCNGPEFIHSYNFGTANLIHKNSSSCPMLCTCMCNRVFTSITAAERYWYTRHPSFFF